MELMPAAYRFLVRPRWFTKHYISDLLCDTFDFDNQFVLEFGCGVGSNSRMFHPRDYLGVDCDERRISYAARLCPRYHFCTVNGPHLPLADHTADAILIVSVLHHIPSGKLDGYLREFKRVLKTGGEVIVLEPYLDRRFRLHNVFMKWFDRGKYIRDEPGYLRLFENNGFLPRVVSRFSQLFFYRKILFRAGVESLPVA
ncbi:MAG: class I SAM-dependent methyltransferase [Christensenellales bacterium]